MFALASYPHGRRSRLARLLVTPLAGLALVRGGAPPAHATGDADVTVQSALEARYAALKEAMAARDSNAVSALLAPDFRSEDVSGKVSTAAEMTSKLSALPKDSSQVSETTLLSVNVVGDTATVQQRYHMTTTRLGADSSKHGVDLVSLSTDTWVRVHGAWLLQRTVTDHHTYKIDGRVVQDVGRKAGN